MAILKGVKQEINVRVTAVIPQDLGATIKVPFVVTYRKLKHKERKEALEQIESGELGDFELLEKYVVGWSQLKGADGQDVEFSPEMLEEVADEPEYLQAIIQGFFTAQLGRAAVRAGN